MNDAIYQSMSTTAIMPTYVAQNAPKQWQRMLMTMYDDVDRDPTVNYFIRPKTPRCY